VIKFPEKPNINIKDLEKKVKDYIAKNLSISQAGEDLISIGDEHIYCTGTRTHVKSTSEIKNLKLHKDYMYDPISKDYMLVGTVGKKESVGYEDISEDLEKEG
jgi:translation elongation factor EF-1beta